MDKELLQQAAQYNKKRKRRKIWQRVVTVMAAMVVFVTTYLLILPAITRESQPTCGLTEHEHTDACYQKSVTRIVCEQPKDVIHQHNELCYDAGRGLICALPETKDLDTTPTDVPVHNHTKECLKEYELVEPVLLCDVQEHTHHEILCYLDESVEMEKAEDWQKTLPSELTKQWPVDLVAVAASQKGYEESKTNVSVIGEGDIKGATRYGIWYGDPYGDWNTMFVSFCLYYAGISDDLFPYEANSYRWALELENQGLYEAVSTQFTPNVGDLAFFDMNTDSNADRVGIITKVVPPSDASPQGELVVIEGDTANNKVEEITYPLVNQQILGYGTVTQAYRDFLASTKLKAPLMYSVAPMATETTIAKKVDYNKNLFTAENSFVVYTVSNNRYYAFDGNGTPVEIFMGQNDAILTTVSDPKILLWTFTASGGTNSYLIQNVSTGRYMHAYPNNGSGVVTSGAYTSVISTSGSGIRIKSNNEYAMLDTNSMTFKVTTSQNSAAVYQLGLNSQCTLWLDGSNGGIMMYGGSPNTAFTVSAGTPYQLPDTWQSPDKYDYKLAGWYDISHSRYYAPGSYITISENTVLYADWVAKNYDIGQFNEHVANTVSTKDYITTHVFDYSSMFNLLSLAPSVTANASSHSETWKLITSGNVPYNNQPTINYILRDWDRGNRDISYPNGTGGHNTNGGVYSGLYSDKIADLLFNPETSYNPQDGSGVIGKQYLGTGDHLFQYMTDPNDPHYGYYYYDSTRNAASFNQSEGRFYVYDYLERTSDSANANDAAKYSDFLPLNSPYVNTNGKKVVTYSYSGDRGEYEGTTHYLYDSKYNSGSATPSNTGANLWFGMRSDLKFFLPNVPGTRDEDGNYGNKDLYGKDMHFQFSGDDDVWVLVDGKLVLDIGGIHGVESGDINFSTGVVTVNGSQTGTLEWLTEGDHVLSLLYLERGSSQSNCAIYFNLAPRFQLTLQKEDVLSQEKLDGAEFSVYTDKACTIPAQLWVSEAAHNAEEPSTNVFTVLNGSASIWGFSSGKMYYIKETKAPDNPEYSCANGIICFSLDKEGEASYSVEILPENGIVSNGFTVHGFRIDEEKQQAFFVVTNAKDSVKETTTVQVYKQWNDTADHSNHSVHVYLTVEDEDGTVRRIREIMLSDANEWNYIWTSLPKYLDDGTTPVVYKVEEGYSTGYYGQIERVNEIVITTTAWAEAYSFEQGKEYVLKTTSGCLSTTSATAGTFKWVDEETAKNSSLALWKVTASGSSFILTNREGQRITYNHSSWSSSSRYFYPNKSNTNYQSLSYTQTTNGVKIYAKPSGNNTYYFGALNSNQRGAAQNQNNGLTFVPMTLVTKETVQKVQNYAYKITNTPLKEETSLTVTKTWDVGTNGDNSLYQQLQVTVKLLANGKETGRTLTLGIKNNWSDVFLGLPYKDADGNVIRYTVEESWDTYDWTPTYGPIVTIGGTPNRYETGITNTYRWGYDYELPATGGEGNFMYTAGGLVCLGIAAGVLMYKRKKRRKEDSAPP